MRSLLTLIIGEPLEKPPIFADPEQTLAQIMKDGEIVRSSL